MLPNNRAVLRRVGGACVRCKKAHRKCVYVGGHAPCQACTKGGHACLLPSALNAAAAAAAPSVVPAQPVAPAAMPAVLPAVAPIATPGIAPVNVPVKAPVIKAPVIKAPVIKAPVVSSAPALIPSASVQSSAAGTWKPKNTSTAEAKPFAKKARSGAPAGTNRDGPTETPDTAKVKPAALENEASAVTPTAPTPTPGPSTPAPEPAKLKLDQLILQRLPTELRDMIYDLAAGDVSSQIWFICESVPLRAAVLRPTPSSPGRNDEMSWPMSFKALRPLTASKALLGDAMRHLTAAKGRLILQDSALSRLYFDRLGARAASARLRHVRVDFHAVRAAQDEVDGWTRVLRTPGAGGNNRLLEHLELDLTSFPRDARCSFVYDVFLESFAGLASMPMTRGVSIVTRDLAFPDWFVDRVCERARCPVRAYHSHGAGVRRVDDDMRHCRSFREVEMRDGEVRVGKRDGTARPVWHVPGHLRALGSLDLRAEQLVRAPMV